MTLRGWRPGLRGRLLAAVVLGIAAVLVALTAGFDLVLARRLDHDATSVLRARASAELDAVRIHEGRLSVPEAPDVAAVDAQIWVFARGHALERPRRNAPNDRAARRLTAGGKRIAEVEATGTRLYALPVIQDGRRLGTVVSGVSLEPYERSRRTALIGSLVFAAAVLAIVALAARWLISGALRPVSRMTAQAADWSDRNLDRRFAAGAPHDELSRLAATLDSLLDRVAASLRREQRFSAELSHELRTPLASIAAEAQLALRRERTGGEYRAGYEKVLSSTRRMKRTLDTLLAAARAESTTERATSDAQRAATAAVEACAALAAERGLEVVVDAPDVALRVGAEAELVERALAPLIENGCRYGRRTVRVTIGRNGAFVRYAVEDDGPGVSEADRELIFEPGRRGIAAGGASASDGAGLGLALSRRLARVAGGEVEAAPAASGGRFVARFPAG